MNKDEFKIGILNQARDIYDDIYLLMVDPDREMRIEGSMIGYITSKVYKHAGLNVGFRLEVIEDCQRASVRFIEDEDVLLTAIPIDDLENPVMQYAAEHVEIKDNKLKMSLRDAWVYFEKGRVVKKLEKHDRYVLLYDFEKDKFSTNPTYDISAFWEEYYFDDMLSNNNVMYLDFEADKKFIKKLSKCLDKKAGVRPEEIVFPEYSSEYSRMSAMIDQLKLYRKKKKAFYKRIEQTT